MMTSLRGTVEVMWYLIEPWAVRFPWVGVTGRSQATYPAPPSTSVVPRLMVVLALVFLTGCESPYESCMHAVRTQVILGRYDQERWRIAVWTCRGLEGAPSPTVVTGLPAVEPDEHRRRWNEAFSEEKGMCLDYDPNTAPKTRKEVRKGR